MDFGDAFGVTFREVGEGERDGKPTHIVRATRFYPTAPQDLWDAFTDKERVRRWFAEVSGDFRPGGHFSVMGNADGEIVVCQPPKALAVTWEYGGNTSWVKVAVEETEGGALLKLEHELPTDEKSEAHWDQYGPGATGVGWEFAFIGLDVHISGDGEPLLEAAAAWAETTQGKATLSSWARSWGNAHIEAGKPAQIANAMAVRTAGFYTGEG